MTNLPSTEQIGVRLLEIANEIEHIDASQTVAPEIGEAIGLIVAGLMQMGNKVGLGELSEEHQKSMAKTFDNVVRKFNWERDQAAETIRSCVRTYSW